ncbi:MMPL family transporter [Spongiibacter sp. KMU-166]|uniref:MMPL family transporter n=1 Tax=Spongiibacter thalassae TaxID=2721624 RepID=A0ABX1GCW6_9GAMM|nr:MMPL family transporter [Spongiibacter thalassae]NKI17009.1 MMPL family transporter [Spongiibacter thalassae]
MLNRLLDYPRTLLLFALGVVLYFAWQSQYFEINASADTLIADNNEQYLRSREISQKFSPEEFLIIAFRPKQGKVFSRDSQAVIAELSERLLTFKRVESVRSIINVPLLSRYSGPLHEGLNPEELTQQHLQLSPKELAKRFRDHPVYEDLIVTRDMTSTGIQVLFRSNPAIEQLERKILRLKRRVQNAPLSEGDHQRLEQLERQLAPLEKSLREQRHREVATLRDIVNDYRDKGEFFLGGPHVLGYQLINIIKDDLLLFGSAIAALICAMLLLLFRQLRWLFVTLTCCAASLAVTLGLFANLGLKATVISSNFVALQLILSLALVIHLIVQYREEANKRPSASQREIVLATLKEKTAPCFFAGLTTSIGFASLILSDIKPVSSFGWMMVLAMAISLVSTLILFPALLLLFSRPLHSHHRSLFDRPVAALQRSCTRRGGTIVVLSSLALILGVVGALRLTVENSFINYFDSDTEVYQELSFIDRKFGGSTPLDIIYTPPAREAKGRDGQLLLRAVDIQQAQRIQSAIETFPAVGTTLSIVNVTQLAREMNNDKPLTEYELTAVYWSLDSAVRENLVSSYFTDNPPQLRISTRIHDSLEGLNRADLLRDLRASIADLGIPAEQIELSNLLVLYQAMLEQLFESQILTLGTVFAALFIAFIVIFRSLAIALAAMAPNILSAAAILGIMGWLGIPLDFMTMTIAAVAMGIAVDDTIHYVHRFRKEAQQHSSAEALRLSHQSVGYALCYTTVIITCGFALLGFSDFIPSVLFGLLTALAIVIALFADLMLLPVLLHYLHRDPSQVYGNDR